nr:red NE sensor nLightR [synthetic construct]
MKTIIALSYIFCLVFADYKDDDDAVFLSGNASDSSNCTHPPPPVNISKAILLGVILGGLILFGVLGNILVILSVACHRHLHSVTHYYIVNLAVADLLLTSTVLPFSAIFEILGYWAFGRVFCNIWAAVDVLCCTASIMGLCLISIDRYWAISSPERYERKMTPKAAFIALLCVWALSLVISIGPLFGWRQPAPEDETICQINEEPGYVLFSALGSFYVPLTIILVMYCRVYRIAQKQLSSFHVSERMYPEDGALKSEIKKGLRLKDGGHYAAEVKTTYKAKKPVQLPGAYIVDIKLDIVSHNEDYTIVEQCERAEGRHSTGGMDELYKGGTGGSLVSKGEEDNMAIIKEFMRFKVHMEGSVNGHEFEIEGEGEGRPYEAFQTAKLKVTKGGPLPFAWDILSPQFMYGSKAYIKHPADIPDYFKLSFPEGFRWERVMNFEDGGIIHVNQDSSLQDGVFIYKVKLRGTNFPPDGPVMQKKTMGWEARKDDLKRETKVLKTLGIVVGCFVLCWLPFFLVMPIGSFFPDFRPSETVFKIAFWLGYLNSCINPIIYPCSSQEFKKAFQNVLRIQCLRRKQSSKHALGYTLHPPSHALEGQYRNLVRIPVGSGETFCKISKTDGVCEWKFFSSLPRGSARITVPKDQSACTTARDF